MTFGRECTLHDREINRIAPDWHLMAGLEMARDLQQSEFLSVQVKGWVVAGQIKAEMKRRKREAA
jgi:hypothetical protein